MGHFSHNCKLTSLPITGGTPAVLIPMVLSTRIYDNSEKTLKEFGSTYMCSNDGPRLKFIPCYFPIRGTYDDYGGLENIIKDDGTDILEKYFGLDIDTIVGIICCGRKDDGYSSILDSIKDPKAKDEYGKPIYLERYKELVKVSGMWIHRRVYDELSLKPKSVDEYGGLDLGTPALLEAFGFTEMEEKGTDERYNRRFKKGELIINSDGTWVNVPGKHLYRLSDFAQYCENEGEPILDLGKHLNKDYVEQLYDYVIPKNEKFWNRPNNFYEPSKKDIIRYQKSWKETFDYEISEEDVIKNLKEKDSGNLFIKSNREAQTIAYKLLNTDGYSCYNITNNIVFDYYEACKSGKLKEVLTGFWRFDSYMYSTGTFYDVVGTGPQDGDIDKVKKVLDLAAGIADERYNEYHQED